MATGPEHYLLAENALLTATADLPHEFSLKLQLDGIGHAILALAAATALNDADGGTSPDDYRAWRRVASVELVAEQAARDAEGGVCGICGCPGCPYCEVFDGPPPGDLGCLCKINAENGS